MEKAIYFDMDGTIADFYGVNGWRYDLIDGYIRPYRQAKSLINMRELGKLLNALQADGWHLGIVSWTSKGGSEQYNAKVAKAKKNWLARHIGAVDWDEIKIVPYGTPKASVVENPMGLLFDDEKPNRDNWTGEAHDVDQILETLAALL